jgi:hypothetical protein
MCGWCVMQNRSVQSNKLTFYLGLSMNEASVGLGKKIRKNTSGFFIPSLFFFLFFFSQVVDVSCLHKCLLTNFQDFWGLPILISESCLQTKIAFEND